MDVVTVPTLTLTLTLPCFANADFKEMDVVMVLPSEAALDALKQEVFEVEGSDVIPEDGPLPPGSPPRASFMTQSKARPRGSEWGCSRILRMRSRRRGGAGRKITCILETPHSRSSRVCFAPVGDRDLLRGAATLLSCRWGCGRDNL